MATMAQLDGLVFPKLLPGHTWQVDKDDESFIASWDSWLISIVRKRKYWFDQTLSSKRVRLDEAHARLKEAGYGGEDAPIPDDEVGRWRMYVMKAAEGLHDAYVERNRIPIRYQAMKEFIATVEPELNVDNNWEQPS